MKNIIKFILILLLVGSLPSCKKYLDINKDPDNILEDEVPINLLLTNVTTSTGFIGGSDLFRYGALLTQQFSGQTTGGETQTQAYEKYLIQSADVNNAWVLYNASNLNDIEVIIKRSAEQGAPHYSGVAKILKAYTYQLMVDAWGDVPYSEAQQTTANLFPKYDKGADVYNEIIKLLNEGIAECNAATSSLSPGSNSTIYTGTFSTKKANWIKFANTLKLRVYLHYSKLDKPFMVNQITTLVNSGAPFFAANADNFEMPFFNAANRQNPIHQFELTRTNYLFANKFLVDMMNLKLDPRRQFYFTQFPGGSGAYVGAKAADPVSQKYSRMHVYLRGAVVNAGPPKADGSYDPTGTNSISYTGDAPIRMFTYSEYNFIRAEAALNGAPGDPQIFFQEGIRASMLGAGVSAADITTYLAANGTLAGTDADKLKQIIEEKYVALYGTIEEPWTDWRRTGFPAIVKVSNAVLSDIPRSLPYAQSEMDLNPNAPPQKSSILEKVFWDK